MEWEGECGKASACPLPCNGKALINFFEEGIKFFRIIAIHPVAQIKKRAEINLKLFFLLNSVWDGGERKERRIIWFPSNLKDADRDRREQCAQKWMAERLPALFKVVKINGAERSFPTDAESWLSLWGWGEELVMSDLFYKWNAVWTARHSHLAVSCHQVRTVPTWPNMLGPPTAKLFTQRPTCKRFDTLFMTAQVAQLPSGNLLD